MNVVREINKINEAELNSGSSASWHDEYKDSAYIFVGGLNFEMSEGDVITIFSQYGEVMNINMPRDKETGKPRGFAFLMYEDQKSTILAVDNLNGAKVLDRTLRVDHVKNYKQPRTKNDETGEWDDAEEEELNAKPEMILDEDGDSDTSDEDDGLPPIDPEDPMYEYLVEQRREAKLQQKSKKSGKAKKSKKHPNETPEERAARKARKKAKKEKEGKKKKSQGVKGVEALLRGFAPEAQSSGRSRSRSPKRSYHTRSRSRTPPRSSYRARSRSPGARRAPDDDRRYDRDREPQRHYRDD